MEGFTITGGYAFSPNFTDGTECAGPGNNPADVVGGAIRDNFNASLTLENMNITGNVAQAAGGAISMENPDFSTPWTLKVVNSTISNNRSGDAGGGINTIGNGRVDITQSVISNNVCENQGAGIWLDTDDVAGPGGTTIHQSALLTVTQSVISGNVGLAPDQFGGGIGNAGNDSLAAGQTPLPGEVNAVSIIDSTIADNVTASTGGGYGDQGGQGTLIVQNSTIANNSANLGGGIQADGPSTTISDSTITGNSSQTTGGGVVVTAGTFTLDNSIVAQNFAGPANFVGGMDPDIMATVSAATGDFIGVKDVDLTLPAGTGNQVGTPTAPLNAQLGPLQNNGGPLAGSPTTTQTVPTERAPLPGSPVIDNGDNALSLPTTDQPRPAPRHQWHRGCRGRRVPAAGDQYDGDHLGCSELRQPADAHGPGRGPGARRPGHGYGHLQPRRHGAGDVSDHQRRGHAYRHTHAGNIRARQSHLDRHLQRRCQLHPQHGHSEPGGARAGQQHDCDFGTGELRQTGDLHGHGHVSGGRRHPDGHGHLQHRWRGGGDGHGHRRYGHADHHSHAGDAQAG